MALTFDQVCFPSIKFRDDVTTGVDHSQTNSRSHTGYCSWYQKGWPQRIPLPWLFCPEHRSRQTVDWYSSGLGSRSSIRKFIDSHRQYWPLPYASTTVMRDRFLRNADYPLARNRELQVWDSFYGMQKMRGKHYRYREKTDRLFFRL